MCYKRSTKLPDSKERKQMGEPIKPTHSPLLNPLQVYLSVEQSTQTLADIFTGGSVANFFYDRYFEQLT